MHKGLCNQSCLYVYIKEKNLDEVVKNVYGHGKDGDSVFKNNHVQHTQATPTYISTCGMFTTMM